uniref:Uncharacterized protein n=1 Tax=Leersia perrieri TaxID=77586 RepID=A0A0D9XD52_9ORYZ
MCATCGRRRRKIRDGTGGRVKCHREGKEGCTATRTCMEVHSARTMGQQVAHFLSAVDEVVLGWILPDLELVVACGGIWGAR